MHAFAAVFLSAFALGGAPSGELLDFTASWCGPCQQMAPLVDRLARQGYPVRKVDVDQNKDLARQYGIQSIPAFVLVVNGKVMKQATGMQSEGQLLQMLAMIPRPAPESVQPKAPLAAPEFNKSKAPTRLLVDSRGTLPRELISMISNQPTITAIAAPRKPEPPKTKAPTTPSRGLLGLNLLGRSSKSDPAKKPLPAVVRANLDDQVGSEGMTDLIQGALPASTRIRISDKDGINLGSGTIIESKIGRTLILTCGHIFRNIQPDSVIEVDVFLNGKAETYVGKAVKYDLEADLGMIAIPTDNLLPCSAIADQSQKPAKGSAVESVGCGQGNDPTLQKHLVTAVNRYTGPENIECTGVPVQGRSGGGLFTLQGQLVGICMAADTKERRGLYVGLGAVNNFLQQCELQRLVPGSGMEDESMELPEDPERLLVEDETQSPGRRGLAALQAAMDQAKTADVVCLVRAARSSPAGQRVVILSSGRSRTQVKAVAASRNYDDADRDEN